MPRFVRGKEEWLIELDGVAFHVTSGGKTNTRKFVTVDHARTQYDKAIVAQTALGFDAAPEPVARELDFLAPDDVDRLAVHADAIADTGHGYGELLSVHVALHRLGDEHGTERHSRLLARSGELLRHLHDELLGGLAAHARSVTAGVERGTGAAGCVATWRLGVIDEVRLEATSKISLSEMVPLLARLPAARHLRALVVGPSVSRAARGTPTRYDRFVAVLTEAAMSFPRVRSLFLGDLREGTVAEDAGDLRALLAAWPQLEELRIHANHAELGAELPSQLLDVELVGGVATLATLHRLRAARSLRSLGAEFPPEPEPLQEALSLLAGFPELRRLALPGWGGRGKIDSVLAFPQLSRLRELDLRHCDLVGELGALVAHAEAFAHLEKLDLRFNELNSPRDLFQQLRLRLPRASVAGQEIRRRENRERYDSIRE